MRLSALALTLSLATLPAAGAGPAAATGGAPAGRGERKVTVNGEAAELSHAYLTPEPGTAGVVTLANIAVGPELRNQTLMFEKREPVKQGKLYLMNVKLDAKGQILSCEIYHRKLGPMQHTSVTGMGSFEKTEMSAAHVRGRLSMNHPWKSPDGETEIFFDVSFDATH
jgi:hypothetical protein